MPWTPEPGEQTIPDILRQKILTRDGHQCVATMRDTGLRCPEKTQLEVDHILNKKSGGKNNSENLQTLCQWHHQKKTQEESRKARQESRKKIHQDKHPGEL
ncbi:MAG: HNH endonuclease [Propionibacteriaceae bacterium]|nr:HNH endonuclease [Propionibacteriaceae bacterium]